MEFEKNAKTHGKFTEKIFVNKKMLRCTFLSSLCDVIGPASSLNNIMPGICLNFVMEKIDFVMENLWKTHGKKFT